MNRRRADRIASIVFPGLCLTVVVVILHSCYPFVRGAFLSPKDIEVADPAAAVRDARALIARGERVPVWPRELPPSLRLPDLHYAKVHRDHVDLVVARNPDWVVGARIWAPRHRAHQDQPTRYPEIWFFNYTHELPESLTNIP